MPQQVTRYLLRSLHLRTLVQMLAMIFLGIFLAYLLQQVVQEQVGPQLTQFPPMRKVQQHLISLIMTLMRI